MPRAIIVGGPNGAGKTTFAREYLPEEASVSNFVNTDLIAAGLSPFDSAAVQVASGRIVLELLTTLASERQDFAVESTLSGRSLMGRIAEWKTVGYRVELYYLRLSSPETALSRIRRRVTQGGHNVSESDVRRRFSRSLGLLDDYKRIVDEWYVFNNDGTTPILVESSRGEI
jgi:predicted ABC-type ATPase